jgi:hypothetical protein
MNPLKSAVNRNRRNELESVVEPLASYICATEQPKTALMSALAVLFREVEITNRAALSHFRTSVQN